jgi:hypothetical protein
MGLEKQTSVAEAVKRAGLAELSPGLRPISANLSRVFFFKLPQNRHPERSASQMDRVTQRLWRGVEEPVPSVAEGTSAVLNLPNAARSFLTTGPG